MRLSRLCIYCDTLQKKLSRHLRNVHSNESKVKEIINGGLSQVEERRAFARLRNEGIVESNKRKEAKEFERIKKSKTSSVTVHCSKCKGSYNKTYFYRHKQSCRTECNPPKPIAAALAASKETNDFLEILSSFQVSEVGELCRKDPTIRCIGRHLWAKDKTKVDKREEVRKTVMADMRTLSSLFILFQKHSAPEEHGDASAMFNREWWHHLRDAIEELTTEDEKVKYGLKNSIYYLLMRSADILQGEALTNKDENGKVQVEEMANFKILLKHHQNLVFGDCKYLINKARQERLRLPARTPPEEIMKTLRDYTVDRIGELVGLKDEYFGPQEFVELRNLTCSRLTLFNARRGGEPCRMTVKQWVTRAKWRSKAQEEEQIFKDMDVTYCTGKGNHLISIIVPNDCVASLNLLTEESKRKDSRVLRENNFIFPNLGSLRHVGGWDATVAVMKKADIECSLINATNQRARISTLYAQQDVTPHDRELFYKHLGHSAEVNQGTYQRPLPALAVQRVGGFLKALDSVAKEKDSCGKRSFGAFTTFIYVIEHKD